MIKQKKKNRKEKRRITVVRVTNLLLYMYIPKVSGCQGVSWSDYQMVEETFN